MTTPAPEQCRSCSAPVRFGRMPSGKVVPFNLAPHPMGTHVLAVRDGVVVAEAYREADHAGRNRFASHFATCPQAAQWRKGGRGAGVGDGLPRSPCACGVVSRWCRKCGACQANGHAWCGCPREHQQ